MNLVSLMIALTIGAMLIAGGYALFTTVQAWQLKLEAAIDHHQALQQVQLLLKRAKQDAMVSLCGEHIQWQGIENYPLSFAERTTLQPIMYVMANSSLIDLWGLRKSGNGKIATNSPVLAVHAVTHSAWLNQALLAQSETLILPKSMGLKENKFLVLQDCRHIVIDKISKVSSAGGFDRISLQHKLAFNFPHGAMASELTFTAYYIGQTGLYAQNMTGTRYDMVPDVTVDDVQKWLAPS